MTPDMLSTPALNDDQLNDFDRDGYLIVRAAFNAREVAAIETWTRELAALPEETGRHWVYREKSLLDPGREILSRIENIAAFHEGFAQLTEVLKVSVDQLLGEEAVLFKEKINFKMPGGDGFKPHQDSQAGWDTYASYFVNVLVSIDETTIENGCLMLVPGFHRRGLFRSWEPLTEKDMEGMSFVPCETRPGDLVLFDSYAPHASEPNLSASARRLYYVTYNRLSEGDHLAQYYADKHRNYPPNIDREAGKEYVFRV